MSCNFRLALYCGMVVAVQGFAGLTDLVSHVPHGVVAPAALHQAHLHLASSTSAIATANPAVNLLHGYTQTLKAHPLSTKMATGAVLATCGDAIAQSTNTDDYDRRRAVSFGLFDTAYRALQHVSFPVIIAHCHGQYATALLSSLGVLSVVQGHTDWLAAMEQTLASQLGIVPFLYYPVFFALTGAVQGLSADQAMQRAQENFIPLMKRNLLFWIPVQFVQFGFVPLDLQIPFLSVCGLCWTFILSAAAGSAKGYNNSTDDEELAVVSEELVNMVANLVLEEAEEKSFVKAGVVEDVREEILTR